MAKFFISSFLFACLAAVNATNYYVAPAAEPMPMPAPVPEPSMIASPIFSNQKVFIKNVAGNINRAQVPTIVIESGAVPINMVFKSSSASLNAQQQHANAAPSVQTSDSVDGTIVLKHSVKKPVAQYVSETIVPSRYLVQKVMPVKEFVKTIVSKKASAYAPAPMKPMMPMKPMPMPMPMPEYAPTMAPATTAAPAPEPMYKPMYEDSDMY